jgi:hypothetical protein
MLHQKASCWKSTAVKSRSIAQKLVTITQPFGCCTRFSKLAGLSTLIYQTVHQGALAFLIVVSSGYTLCANHSEKLATTSSEKPKSSAFTRWKP